jgi:alkane 1-monooxygenase
MKLAQQLGSWRFAIVLTLGLGPGIQALVHGEASLLGAWLPFLMIHAVIPAIDHFLPSDTHGPQPAGWRESLLPALCLPVWWASVVLGFMALPDPESWRASPAMSLFVTLGLVLSLGAAGGILAINPAHELIHRTSPWLRRTGGWLLASVGYGAFKIEHIRGHHLRVATPEDTATARLGMSVYTFIPRSIIGTLRHAYALDARESRRWGVASALVWGSWTFAWCWLEPWSGAMLWQALAGLGLAAVVSLVAIVELELINYIEHYGLERERQPSGRYETVAEHHSWNVNTPLVNAYLFNLQRHSDHHAHAARPYSALRSMAQAPQLPANYGLMIALALVPPWWRRIMDPRVQRVRRGPPSLAHE